MKTAIFRARGERGLVQRIGKYEVAREVGASKHTRIKVFQATDRDLGRPVTLKLVADATDPRLADRFRREVSIIARLRVANVIGIYEMGEEEGLPFAAMQHLGDDNLEAAINSDQTLALLQRMRFIEQVAAGVADSHRAGLSYVGIHPSGIAIGYDGVAVLQDFGVVRLGTGKPNEKGSYTTPEQNSAAFVPDSLCDVFAFGLLCYEFLTGSHPFQDGGADEEAVPLRRWLPECPEMLDRLVSRSLEKQRRLRYQDFDEIRDDLRPILQALKRSRAAALWADSRQLIDSEKLEEAQGMVREALQLDPDDPNGQQINSDLRVLLQRQETRGRLEELWRQADEVASHRRFFAAVDILESAARLDGADAETQSRLEKMRARLGHSLEAAQLAGQAKLLMDQGEWDQARMKALEALERDAEEPEAVQLLELIRQAAERHAREARIEEGILRARSLVLQRSFDQAVAILNGLRADDPDSALIQRWIAHVEGQKKAVDRQDRLQKLTSQAESLVTQQRFAEAVALLEPEANEFSGERRLIELLRGARESLERMRVVDDTTASCNQLCQEQCFDQAHDIVERALGLMPGEPGLLALRQRIEAQADVREVLEEVDWLIDQDRPDLAVRFLRDSCGGVLDEPNLAARLQKLEHELTDWELNRLLEALQECLSRGGSERKPNPVAVLLPVLEEALRTADPGYEVAAAAERLRNGLRKDALVAEVRHYLSAANIGQAEQVFQKGLEFLRAEDSADTVQQEIEACRKSVEDWRAAQVLVGQRRLVEAEQVLLGLTGPNRPETQELLELVRALQAASDQNVFCAQVKETALRLANQGRLDDADRVFRRLLRLFPGDEELEKDRMVLRAGSRDAGPKEADRAAEAPEPWQPRPAPELWQGGAWALTASRHFGPPKAAVILVVLVLTAAGAAVWRSARSPVSAPDSTAIHSQESSRPVETEPQSLPPGAPVVNGTLEAARQEEPARQEAATQEAEAARQEAARLGANRLASQQAITRTLKAFQDAYTSMNLEEIKRLWSPMDRRIEDKTRDMFRYAKTFVYQLQCATPTLLTGDSAIVDCDCTIALTPKDDKPAPQVKEHVEVTVHRVGANWVIRDVALNR